MCYNWGMRALIYTRVSEDRAGGRSPAEQESDARQVCEREGWDVAAVITDTVGASRHSKGTRGGWAKAKTMIAKGDVDVLVTWEASRAQRDLTAYAELRDLCVANNVLWNYSGRTRDLASKDDRFTSGLDALLAEREADETSHRVQRAIRANAIQGRPHGRRLFGYTRVYDPTSGALTGQTPNSDEAPTVARMFADYLGGAGCKTIARTLNAEDVTTGSGAKWSDKTVHDILTNPAFAARRVHRGEIIGAANWPAIVTDDTFDRVQARLQTQKTYAARANPRARLLTGTARCGVCGAKAGVIHDRNYRKVYACKAKYCVTRDLNKVDAFVSDLIVERLSRPDVAEALRDAPTSPAVDDARTRLAGLKARLDEAVNECVAGRLSPATLARLEAQLLPQIRSAEGDARQALLPINLEVPASGVAKWWDGLTDEVKREVVRNLFAAIVIKPSSKRGARVFDPDCVQVEWKR